MELRLNLSIDVIFHFNVLFFNYWRIALYLGAKLKNNGNMCTYATIQFILQSLTSCITNTRQIPVPLHGNYKNKIIKCQKQDFNNIIN